MLCHTFDVQSRSFCHLRSTPFKKNVDGNLNIVESKAHVPHLGQLRTNLLAAYQPPTMTPKQRRHIIKLVGRGLTYLHVFTSLRSHSFRIVSTHRIHLPGVGDNTFESVPPAHIARIRRQCHVDQAYTQT